MFNQKVIEQVAILFLIMGIGVYTRKSGILIDVVKKGITDLILTVTVPLLIISSFNQPFSTDLLRNAALIFLISIGVHSITFFLSRFLFNRFPDDKKNVLRYMSIFSNSGFMGYPVLFVIYGKIGVFYGSIYAVPYNVFMLALGAILFSDKKEEGLLKGVALHPATISAVVGFMLFLVSFQFPSVLSQTMSMVGSITTPLSMILIGSMLADAQLKHLFEGSIFYGTFIRLILMPISTLLILRTLGLPKEIVGISVVLAAMPAGSMTAILAGKYNSNSVFASKCVFVSTLFSIITIPLILMLL